MRSYWIVNKKYDLFFFIGSVIFSWIFLFIYNWNPFPDRVSGTDYTLTALVVYFTFTTFFDHPHVFQMVSRIYYDKTEFNRRRWIYTWGLIGFVFLGWIIIFFNLDVLWSNIYSTVGALHIIGQNLGFFKIYRAKAGQVKNLFAKFEVAAFVSLSLVAVFQYYKPASSSQNLLWELIVLPPVFFLSLNIVAFVALAFLFYSMYREIRSKTFSLPKWLFAVAILITDFVMFNQSHVPLIVLVVLETAYHDIQYQGWTSHYQRHRFNKASIARNFFILAMAYGVVVGALEFMEETGADIYSYLFMPFTMFVFFHYCLDGKIWKMSSSPELKKII